MTEEQRIYEDMFDSMTEHAQDIFVQALMQCEKEHSVQNSEILWATRILVLSFFNLGYNQQFRH